MKDESMISKNHSSKEFISFINSDVADGHSLSPFVGSGLSAPSGILMGQTFTNYLGYVAHRVLDNTSGSRLDLATLGWPQQPTHDEVKSASEFIKDQFKKICAEKDFEVQGDIGELEVIPVSSSEKQKLSTEVRSSLRPLVPAILRPSFRQWKTDTHLATTCEREGRLDSILAPQGLQSGSPTSDHYQLERGIRSLFAVSYTHL